MLKQEPSQYSVLFRQAFYKFTFLQVLEQVIIDGRKLCHLPVYRTVVDLPALADSFLQFAVEEASVARASSVASEV